MHYFNLLLLFWVPNMTWCSYLFFILLYLTWSSKLIRKILVLYSYFARMRSVQGFYLFYLLFNASYLMNFVSVPFEFLSLGKFKGNYVDLLTLVIFSSSLIFRWLYEAFGLGHCGICGSSHRDLIVNFLNPSS
jgi:hypothetical protein